MPTNLSSINNNFETFSKNFQLFHYNCCTVYNFCSHHFLNWTFTFLEPFIIITQVKSVKISLSFKKCIFADSSLAKKTTFFTLSLEPRVKACYGHQISYPNPLLKLFVRHLNKGCINRAPFTMISVLLKFFQEHHLPQLNVDQNLKSLHSSQQHMKLFCMCCCNIMTPCRYLAAQGITSFASN